VGGYRRIERREEGVVFLFYSAEDSDLAGNLPDLTKIVLPVKGARMNSKKKKWAKPELLVLVKGNLEENVLAVCKAAQGSCPYKACSALNGRCDGIGVS
jgi:hypothetical protein